MTNKQFAKTVSASCKSVMKKLNFRYVDIEINYSLPTISVGMNGCEFFAQGEGAGDLIAEAVATSNKTNLAVSTCLIWYLDSCGCFNK